MYKSIKKPMTFKKGGKVKSSSSKQPSAKSVYEKGGKVTSKSKDYLYPNSSKGSIK